jgi:NADH-quinone oxidoreductase subunit N
VITAGVGSGVWLLLGFLVVNSVIGVYYYLRIVVAMFTRAGGPAGRALPAAGWPAGIALVLLVAILLWIGVFPSPLVEWIRDGSAAIG